MTDSNAERVWYPTNPDELKSLVTEIDTGSGLYPDLAKMVADFLYHPDTLPPRTIHLQPDSKWPVKNFDGVQIVATIHFQTMVPVQTSLHFWDLSLDIGRSRLTHEKPCPVSSAMCTRCPISDLRVEMKRFGGIRPEIRDQTRAGFNTRLRDPPLTLVMETRGGLDWTCQPFVIDTEKQIGLFCQAAPIAGLHSYFERASDVSPSCFCLRVAQFDALFLNAMRAYGSLLPIASELTHQQTNAQVSAARTYFRT